MWGALRSSRDFRLLVIGELVSRSGSAASFVAVWSLAVYEFGVSPGVLSLLALCNTVPRVVASMVAGRMVDRHGPRLVLIVANVVGLVGSLAQFASSTPLQLGIASVVAGAGFGAFMPAIGSMTPRVVDQRHLLPANAILELTWQIGFVVGPLAGALSILIGGTRAPLLFDIATFIVAIACIAPVRLRPVEHGDVAVSDVAVNAPGAESTPETAGSTALSAESTTPTAELTASMSPTGTAPAAVGTGDGFLASLRYTWSLPVARFVLVLSCGSWIGISFFIVLEPLYVDQVLDKGPAVLGLLQTAFGAGAIVGAALASRAERRVTPLLVALTIVVCGTGMIIYTATTSVGVAAAGVAWWGVGLGLWAPFERTMIHRGVPVSHHGRVNGVMSSLQSGLEVLPVLAAGQLASLVGIQATLIGAGVVTLVFAGWGCLAAPGISRSAISATYDDRDDVDDQVATGPVASTAPSPPITDGLMT